MPITLVSPMNDAAVAKGQAAPRLAQLAGRRLALLDISKPGGQPFLDRLERLLRDRFALASVDRIRKATYTKPATPDVLDALRGADAVIEALAD